MAAEAIAFSKGTLQYKKVAYDHAGFAIFYGLHSPTIVPDDAELASSSGVSTTASFANAHAVFPRSCGPNSALRRRAEDASDESNGTCQMGMLANDHAVLERS